MGDGDGFLGSARDWFNRNYDRLKDFVVDASETIGDINENLNTPIGDRPTPTGTPPEFQSAGVDIGKLALLGGGLFVLVQLLKK